MQMVIKENSELHIFIVYFCVSMLVLFTSVIFSCFIEILNAFKKGKNIP